MTDIMMSVSQNKKVKIRNPKPQDLGSMFLNL